MRLLDVKAVLDRESDVQGADPEIEVLRELDDKTAIYAILSHRWGSEVNYDDMTGLMKMDAQDKNKIRQRDGYQKIIRSCEQAVRDGYPWLWIDTCCIDKRSSAELSEAINSMYRWYRNSHMCYVYLNDVDESAFPTEQDFSTFGRFNGWPEWFSRGWTLQELVAPKEAEFFNKSWVPIGTKQDLISTLEAITRIPGKVLRDEQVLRSTESSERPHVAHVMSWAAHRKTTRVEDRAYSLLGLFGVNMPMLYGEGSKAFQRLQLEIIRVSSDHSIFAWNPKGCLGNYGSVLADDPSCFRDCHDMENVDPHEFDKELAAHTHPHGLDMDREWTKLLSLHYSMESLQLAIFNVTNVGIQVSLPVMPDRDTTKQCFKAILPCRDRHGRLVTIDLESRGLSSYRCLGVAWIPNTLPQFRSVYLACPHDAVESHGDFRLDDRRASWHGFIRCGTFPYESTGNTITFSSQGNALVVLVYANIDARSRFAVGLGHYLGQVWSRIVCDEYFAKEEPLSPWVGFAKQVYNVLWNASIHESYFHTTPDMIRDAHLPRTIWDARIVCCSSDGRYPNVMIEVDQCTGCCAGPREHAYTFEGYDLWLLWTSKRYGSHQLQLDGEPAKLEMCSSRKIALGDYGNSLDSNFERDGNIFEDMRQLGIDPTDSLYRPVFSRVSSYKQVPRHMQTQHVVAMTSSSGEGLVLHQPGGVSLPNNEAFELLLRSLSTRLSGKHLVTTIVQCSGFHNVDREGGSKGLGSGSASKILDRSTDSGIFTPLCVIARPLAWHKEPACAWRRQRFKDIREHFHDLADLRHIVVAEARDESGDKQNASGVVDLSAIFGLNYLRIFVGSEITFFERLPSIMETQLRGKASVGTPQENGIRAHPSDASFDPHSAPLLPETCKILDEWSFYEPQRMQNGVKLISQTLGVGLLERIYTFFLNVLEDNQRTGQADHTDTNMPDARSIVQEIGGLQAILEVAEDEDAQRALEEDITGKILWFYWCGICVEVDQLLPKVVEYARKERDPDPRRSGNPADLCEIVEIMKGSPHMDPDDDISHLRRVMLDAGAGISKYNLWRAARAAEQTRWSGALVLGNNPVPGTQEIELSTSPEAPSASIVQQTPDTSKAFQYANLKTRIGTLLIGFKQSARSFLRSVNS